METLLVEKLSGKWEDNPNLKCIIQDGDPKTKKFWESENNDKVPIIELQDSGHAKKRLCTIFVASNKDKHLSGLKKHIIWYFAYLIKRQKYSNDEKILKWENLEEELKECSSKKFYFKSKIIKRKHT